MLHAVLKVVGGKQDGKLIPLNTKKFLIGREQDCHLRPGSESVSRHHCAITIDDFTVRVRDLGSSNGTSINGKRIIGVHEANPGDKLQIGTLDFEIVFEKAGAPVASGAQEKGGTSFTLDDFVLEEADPLTETAMMVGSDTTVISTKDVEAAIEAEAVSQSPAETTIQESQPVPETSQHVTEEEADAASPDDSAQTETATDEEPAVESPESQQQSVVPPPADQQPAPPNYQQPSAPMMPGYGQQMPQQPYPYGMGQPGMPGYGMPQPGYPYGMPQQPMMPGYGMPPQGMPGYGMPQQPMMPGYGMLQPGMSGYGMPQQPGLPYPQQQMPYPSAQPPVDEYDEEEEDEDEEPATFKTPPTVLPDPSETGAVDPVKSDADNGAPKVEAPNPAADILKKYRGGR
ncbi:MAG: FHA domain-containing protein [Rhodopirellula sp.]|nr:FHA domain-containing protein [Rhodopirellula sp.]